MPPTTSCSKKPSGLFRLSLLWDHDHQTGHQDVSTGLHLGAGSHKAVWVPDRPQGELPSGFALQSGADGSHVFVRIRNEWSSESKQLRRAITITRRILLPCLLSCLISELSAFPGKAHMEILTWSF